MSDEPDLTDANDVFDDDIPWADAEVRRSYEAALGGCMLAFNQIDNLLGQILKTILVRLGRQDMVKDFVREADFNQRLRGLDLLKHSAEGAGIANISVDDLRSVAGERNLLAHAHFEQNPVTGEYWLVNRKGETNRHYTAAQIDAVSGRMTKAWMNLRYAEAFYVFVDIPLSE